MAVMTEMDTAWEALRQRLRGERSGEVEVLDVRIKRYDYLLEGDLVEITPITLVLTDPPFELDTWPYENVKELIRRAWDEAIDLRIRPQPSVGVTARPGYDDGNEELDTEGES